MTASLNNKTEQMKKRLLLVCALAFGLMTQAQNSLLDELGLDQSETSPPAFKAMKITNLQSTKIASQGDWYMYVSHRFGSVKGGFDTFYGLDMANTKIEMIYGLTESIQLGMSRESLRQTYAGAIKARIFPNLPFRLAAYSTVNLNAALSKEAYPLMKFYDRLSYATQLLAAKAITSDFSVEIAPTFVRQNLVLEPFQAHEQMALGLGGRYKLTKRLSLNADYVHNFSRHEESVYKNPLSVGIDIETGGHIFQLLFSNAQSANEPGFISNAEGDWAEGDIFFGFHIVRVF